MSKPTLARAVRPAAPDTPSDAAKKKTQVAQKAANMEANPIRGARGDFLKLSVTLSPDTYRLVMEEVVRRKSTKEVDPNISAILREAIVAYFHK